MANIIFLLQCKWAWKDSSKVEISLCFSSGPGFNTYHCIHGHPGHGTSQPSALPVPGDPKSSTGLCRYHMLTKHSHKNK